MATPSTTYAFRQRKEFAGVNDRYSVPTNYQKRDSLKEAIEGKSPLDVTGEKITDNMRDLICQRNNRYREAWRFYKGQHHLNPWEDGEKKIVINYCKPIVDKGVDWLVAKGWKVKCPQGNDQVAEYLMSVWKHNDQLGLTQKAGKFGAVCGDVYLYVTVKTHDSNGKEIEKSKWTISIESINPEYCIPFWNSADSSKLDSILIQYPMIGRDKDGDFSLYSIYITPETYEVWHDNRSVGKQPNPFGAVNVVHIPNFIVPDSDYGASDIEDIIPVNQEYNAVSNNIRRVIKYHAEPTTLIYGVRASALEKGANKVWSNLPENAKVENLKLETDLKAVYEYLKHLQATISKLSSTPEVAFDSKNFSVTNTSGLAMQMLFQPLIEKTGRRQVSYRRGFIEINRLVLIATENILGVPIQELADDQENIYVSDIEFTSPLPRDEQAELDAGLKKKEMGIWSHAELIRRLSGVVDFERLVLELAADERHELAKKYEEQQAALGAHPNQSVVFLGSPFLSEDLLGLAQEVVNEEVDCLNCVADAKQQKADDAMEKQQEMMAQSAAINPQPKASQTPTKQ